MKNASKLSSISLNVFFVSLPGNTYLHDIIQASPALRRKDRHVLLTVHEKEAMFQALLRFSQALTHFNRQMAKKKATPRKTTRCLHQTTPIAVMLDQTATLPTPSIVDTEGDMRTIEVSFTAAHPNNQNQAGPPNLGTLAAMDCRTQAAEAIATVDSVDITGATKVTPSQNPESHHPSATSVDRQAEQSSSLDTVNSNSVHDKRHPETYTKSWTQFYGEDASLEAEVRLRYDEMVAEDKARNAYLQEVFGQTFESAIPVREDGEIPEMMRDALISMVKYTRLSNARKQALQKSAEMQASIAAERQHPQPYDNPHAEQTLSEDNSQGTTSTTSNAIGSGPRRLIDIVKDSQLVKDLGLNLNGQQSTAVKPPLGSNSSADQHTSAPCSEEEKIQHARQRIIDRVVKDVTRLPWTLTEENWPLIVRALPPHIVIYDILQTSQLQILEQNEGHIRANLLFHTACAKVLFSVYQPCTEAAIVRATGMALTLQAIIFVGAAAIAQENEPTEVTATHQKLPLQPEDDPNYIPEIYRKLLKPQKFSLWSEIFRFLNQNLRLPADMRCSLYTKNRLINFRLFLSYIKPIGPTATPQVYKMQVRPGSRWSAAQMGLIARELYFDETVSYITTSKISFVFEDAPTG